MGYPWQGKICNAAQIAGIETSTLDNGPGRSVRIAWVNTGSGLRCKVVIDRVMDIADAFFNQHSIAWLSSEAITAPRPNASYGLEWLYSFNGGLLTTCGLTHVGGPQEDDGEPLGLHDRIANIPAAFESIIQPDPAEGRLDMSITGLVRQSRLFGPNLELRRTISARTGEPTIRILDVVTNRGSTPAPHMILYHCNFGWPLADEGADIIFRGKCVSRGLDMDNIIFNDRHNYRKCRPPMKSHLAAESCGFIDAAADSHGICAAGLANRKLGLAVAIRYEKKLLPALTNWQHWGLGDYVTAIEPGTNPPIGRAEAKKQKTLIMLGPGESRTYRIEITVLTKKNEIAEFIESAG